LSNAFDVIVIVVPSMLVWSGGRIVAAQAGSDPEITAMTSPVL
jgi:hypothetical protein